MKLMNKHFDFTFQFVGGERCSSILNHAPFSNIMTISLLITSTSTNNPYHIKPFHINHPGNFCLIDLKYRFWRSVLKTNSQNIGRLIKIDPGAFWQSWHMLGIVFDKKSTITNPYHIKLIPFHLNHN